MKSIALFNNKGGVGKTTLLCNIASYMRERLHKRVLIIDADPQCNASTYLLGENSICPRGIRGIRGISPWHPRGICPRGIQG